MTKNLDQINETLDKLTLDSLLLIEEHIQTKLEMENLMSMGESHLAKSRYIMGVSNVSALQLPSESSPEFTALVKVSPKEDGYELNSEESSGSNPLRWFGLLVPQNLNLAQSTFKRALERAIEAVNVQTRLRKVLSMMGELKLIKAEIIAK